MISVVDRLAIGLHVRHFIRVLLCNALHAKRNAALRRGGTAARVPRVGKEAVAVHLFRVTFPFQRPGKRTVKGSRGHMALLGGMGHPRRHDRAGSAVVGACVFRRSRVRTSADARRWRPFVTQDVQPRC
jgi:hypothetical protein